MYNPQRVILQAEQNNIVGKEGNVVNQRKSRDLLVFKMQYLMHHKY